MPKTSLFLILAVLICGMPVGAQTQTTHTVAEGETLISIGIEHNVCVEDIIAANPHFDGVLYSVAHLYTGEVITIPLDGTPCYTTDGDYIIYTVEAGDTLFGLSAFYRVPIMSIQRTGESANDSTPNRIEVGEILHIPINNAPRTLERHTSFNTVTFDYVYTAQVYTGFNTPDDVANDCNTTTEQVLRHNGLAIGENVEPWRNYITAECFESLTVHESEVPTHPTLDGEVVVVAPDETLLHIALEHDIHPNALAEVNNISSTYLTVESRTLVFVPTNSIQPPPRDTSVNHYIVRWGDTLTDIARAYNTHPALIAQVNELEQDTVLYIGQTLTIPDHVQADKAVIIAANSLFNFVDRYTATAIDRRIRERNRKITLVVGAIAVFSAGVLTGMGMTHWERRLQP